MFGTFASLSPVLISVLLSLSLTTTRLAVVTTHQAVSSSAGISLNASARTAQASASAGCPNPYVVHRGDTLARIAARCGVSVVSLKRWNGLRSYTIWAGQVLATRPPGGRQYVPVPAPRILPRPTPIIESPVSPW